MSDPNQISLSFKTERISQSAEQSNYNIKCLENVASKLGFFFLNFFHSIL